MNRLILDTDRALSEQVNDALRRLTAKVARCIAAEASDFDEGIHDARTSLKKLRALLRLLRPALASDLFRDEDQRVRDFARQLGGVRDAAVMLSTFEEIRQDAVPYLKQPAIASIEAALKRNYEDAQRAQTPQWSHDTLHPQFERMEKSLLALKPAGFDRNLMLAGLEQVYRDGYHGYRATRAEPDEEHGHAWRKDVKYLWYQLQLFATPERDDIAHYCKKLDRLADTLGHEHDLAVLAQHLARHELFRDAAHEAILRGLIGAAQKRLIDDALRQGKKVYRNKPGEFGDWLRQSLTLE